MSCSSVLISQQYGAKMRPGSGIFRGAGAVQSVKAPGVRIKQNQILARLAKPVLLAESWLAGAYVACLSKFYDTAVHAAPDQASANARIILSPFSAVVCVAPHGECCSSCYLCYCSNSWLHGPFGTCGHAFAWQVSMTMLMKAYACPKLESAL